MKLTDIIALATKGYKPNDIRELIELAKETETVPETAQEPELSIVPSEEQKENVPDYAAEIEELKKENAKIREDLAKAQAANRAAPSNTPEGPSDEDIITDIVRAYMR